MSDEVAAITHHEAGHAVAALMCLHGSVLGHVGVRLIAGKGGGVAHVGIMEVDRHRAEAAFTYYAGPWAEARAHWPNEPLRSLDDTDDKGVSFRQRMNAAFSNASNFEDTSDLAEYNRLADSDTHIRGNEPHWSRELERARPAIAALAGALRDRLQSGPDPFASLEPARKRVMWEASMTSSAVVELVQPLLQERGQWHYMS